MTYQPLRIITLTGIFAQSEILEETGGHSPKKSEQMPKEESPGKSTAEAVDSEFCQICEDDGHEARDCKQLKRVRALMELMKPTTECTNLVMEIDIHASVFPGEDADCQHRVLCASETPREQHGSGLGLHDSSAALAGTLPVASVGADTGATDCAATIEVADTSGEVANFVLASVGASERATIKTVSSAGSGSNNSTVSIAASGSKTRGAFERDTSGEVANFVLASVGVERATTKAVSSAGSGGKTSTVSFAASGSKTKGAFERMSETDRMDLREWSATDCTDIAVDSGSGAHMMAHQHLRECGTMFDEMMVYEEVADVVSAPSAMDSADQCRLAGAKCGT